MGSTLRGGVKWGGGPVGRRVSAGYCQRVLMHSGHFLY